MISHQRFLPAPDAIRMALVEWRHRMEAVGIAPAMVARAELVLAEVCNNIDKHGCAGLSGGWIVLNTRMSGDGLHLTVLDNGTAPPAHLLDPVLVAPAPLQGLPLTAIPEGGYGWFLIRQLARDITMDQSLGCNRLRLRVPPGDDDG